MEQVAELLLVERLAVICRLEPVRLAPVQLPVTVDSHQFASASASVIVRIWAVEIALM